MLQLINIKKDYVMNNIRVHALKDININFRKCEFVSILGQSGCGKTTLLNIIGGLDRYTSGNLVINGISTRDFTDQYWDAYRNSEIGFVFQSYNLIPHLSVLKNVELALNLSGLSHAECEEKAKAALMKVHMEDHIHKKPNQLSGGQMQRVSIARALVNDPRIILADEPTGALDSELGEQVMEVLKEVAQNKLVIMVTHNDELAYRYSTRIVKIKDGCIVDDSDTFVPENPYHEEPLPGKKRRKLPSLRKKNKEAAPFKFTEMKWITAMGISWKNLISKVRHTTLTTIASSIGIIGMGLVLALSNGLNVWMDSMKTSMLATVPIGVYEYSMDYDVMTDVFKTFSTGSGVHGDFPDDGKLHIVESAGNQSIVADMLNTMTSSLKFNDISEEFMEYLEGMPADSYSSLHNYYGTRMNLIARTIDHDAAEEGKYRYKDVSPDYAVTSLSTMAGTVLGNSSLESKYWNQLNSTEFMSSYYDILYGKYPTKKEEIVLVVNEDNEVSFEALKRMGFYESDYDGDTVYSEKRGETYYSLDFSQICGYKLKLIGNDEYFRCDGTDTGYSLPDASELETLYNNEGITLEVVGVLRVKETASMPAVPCNFCYTPELGKYVMEQAQTSRIAASQKRLLAEGSAKNVFSTDMATDVELKGDESFLAIILLLTEGKDLAAFNKYVGADSTPVYINIYAADYDGKTVITQYLDAWNEQHGGKIKYFDVTEMFFYNMKTITDLAVLALLAVAAISLLVSSIMIAIITSTSVTERTREIGILRSIGAKKTDILQMFIAETVIIGALSGGLGVALTYALAPALSTIIGDVSGIFGLAVVSLPAMGLLFVLSIVLAVISGFIPSIIAANKNVVDALRSD